MACDPYYANVSSLLHFDGANGSTVMVDEKSKIWTPNGGAIISTANSKFGGSSLYLPGNGDLNGNGDTISTPSHTDFDLGDVYTIEFWTYMVQNRDGCFVLRGTNDISTGGTGWVNFSFAIRWIPSSSLVVYFYAAGGTEVKQTVDYGFSTGQWAHVAVVRNGGTGYIYVNGVLKATKGLSQTPAASAAPVRVGVYSYKVNATTNNASYLNAYIEELRITKGVARYTANFTPAAIPFEGSCVTNVDLAGAGVAQATATGGLDVATTVPLAGAAIASSTADGALSVGIPLAGDATATANSNGGLNLSIPLTGAASVDASALGSIAFNISLSGAAIADAAAQAGLIVSSVIELSGAAQAQATAAGALNIDVPLSGAALTVSSADGSLTQIVPLAGSAAVASAASGGLHVSVQLSGAALADAMAQAGLTAFDSGSLIGGAAGDASASGSVVLRISLDGAAVAQAVALGALTRHGKLIASPGWGISAPGRNWSTHQPARVWRQDADARAWRVSA